MVRIASLVTITVSCILSVTLLASTTDASPLFCMISQTIKDSSVVPIEQQPTAGRSTERYLKKPERLFYGPVREFPHRLGQKLRLGAHNAKEDMKDGVHNIKNH
ncbi:hypothetical protein BDF22DRAFT_678660 [Syncephalis plumigaleata]|nr:hypothetical protein BDF22DRAFT_678660 [Syncephalis plumigaleata]